MKQYQRASEKEFERLLADEDYQEQIEYQEDLEELRTEFWCGLVAKFKEDNNWTKSLPSSDIGDNQRVVDKIERVMEEMHEVYIPFDEWDYEDDYDDYDVDYDYPVDSFLEPIFDSKSDYQKKGREEDICWEMFRSNYGMHKDKLIVGDYLGNEIRKICNEEKLEDDGDYDERTHNWLAGLNEPFPKHLEYDMDRFRYPIIE